MTNKPSILEMIDSAIEDYSVSDDAVRYASDLRAPEIRSHPSSTPLVAFDPGHHHTSVVTVRRELTPEQRDAMLATLRLFGEAVDSVFSQLFDMVSGICRQVNSAVSTHVPPGIILPPVPPNPMLTAIEARKTRNTGPVVPLRVPRRINPTGGWR